MSCPKNIVERKFLWWTWEAEGEHNFTVDSISKFMYCSKDFVVNGTCTICGTHKRKSFVETEELLREGYDIKDLDKIDGDYSLYLYDKKKTSLL